MPRHQTMVASHGWYADITTNEQSKKGQKVEQIDYHHKSYQVIVLRLLIGLIADGSKKERHFFPPFRLLFTKYLYLCACICPLRLQKSLWRARPTGEALHCRKATLYACFDRLNLGNSNLDKTMQRWRLWMCILCAAGVCRGLIIRPHAYFWCIVYTPT